MPRLKIAALGSSFAAGPNIPPQVNKAAMRSGRNYAHLVAERLDADLTDLTVSGATLLNVIKEPQVTMLRTTFKPQISLLPSDSDIVFLTGGGNDMNYSGGMISEALGQTPVIGGLLSGIANKYGDGTTELQALTARFVEVIDAIHKAAPKAKIILVEYLTVLGSDTKAGTDVSLSQDRVSHYQKLAEVLHTAYRHAAGARSDFAESVPIATLSGDHGVGSQQPWVDGCSVWMILRGFAPFHPNAAGHEAIADVLCDKLRTFQAKL